MEISGNCNTGTCSYNGNGNGKRSGNRIGNDNGNGNSNGMGNDSGTYVVTVAITFVKIVTEYSSSNSRISSSSRLGP